MKGWHSLIPILAIFWTGLIILAVIDHNGQKEEPQIESPPLTIEERISLRVDELNNSKFKRVCDTYLSRHVGIHTTYGIVCVEMGLEVFYTGIGLTGDYSQEHYDQHILPVVDRLHREYRNKYGWGK